MKCDFNTYRDSYSESSSSASLDHRGHDFACKMIFVSWRNLYLLFCFSVTHAWFEGKVGNRYNYAALNGTGRLSTFPLDSAIGRPGMCVVDALRNEQRIVDKRRVAIGRNINPFECGTCLEICGDIGCEYVMLWGQMSFVEQNSLSVPLELRQYLTAKPVERNLKGDEAIDASWWPVEQIHCKEIDPEFYTHKMWNGWMDYYKKHWVWGIKDLEQVKMVDWDGIAWPWWKHAEQEDKKAWLAMWKAHRRKHWLGRVHRALHPEIAQTSTQNYSCDDPLPDLGVRKQAALLHCQVPEPWNDIGEQHVLWKKPSNETALDAALESDVDHALYRTFMNNTRLVEPHQDLRSRSLPHEHSSYAKQLYHPLRTKFLVKINDWIFPSSRNHSRSWKKKHGRHRNFWFDIYGADGKYTNSSNHTSEQRVVQAEDYTVKPIIVEGMP